VRASGALCRAADSSARAPIPRLRAPCRVVSVVLPPALLPSAVPLARAGALAGTAHRDFRCARSAVTAVGLGRRTTADQCAFHRFDLGFAVQVGSAPLVVHARSLAPHPVVCHDPCLPRQRREVRFRLSPAHSHSLAAAPFATGKDASLRLLQPTVPNEHPPDRSIPGCASPAPDLRRVPTRAPTHPGPMASRIQSLGTPNPLTGRATEWSFA